MLFVLIALWTIAAALLLIDRQSGTTRWLAAVAFCGGSGALAVTVDERIIPYFQAKGAGDLLLDLLFYIQAASSWVSYYGLPVSFLMFALYYGRPVVIARHRVIFPWLIAIPALISLWFTPDYSEEIHIHYRAVSLWALPYIGAGTAIMLSRKEWNRTARLIHWMACLAVLLPVLFSGLMNYLLPSLGFYKMWRYNIWFVVIGLVILLFALFNFGFIGIRIRIQKRQLDSTFRAITSGTAILNHAIKNDAGKIKLFGEKIKLHARKTGQPELESDAEVILHAADHVEQMLRRVREQTKDLSIKPESFGLADALDQWLQGLEPVMEQGRIKLQRDYRFNGNYYGDRVQLVEAIGNVISNAVEAMPEGGLLSVRVEQSRKRLEVQIGDTGEGIPSKELSSVLEPFYTTKSNRQGNYGLGLAYSFQVVKKHGGTLDIRSEEGKGTTVFIRLPYRQARE